MKNRTKRNIKYAGSTFYSGGGPPKKKRETKKKEVLNESIWGFMSDDKKTSPISTRMEAMADPISPKTRTSKITDDYMAEAKYTSPKTRKITDDVAVAWEQLALARREKTSASAEAKPTIKKTKSRKKIIEEEEEEEDEDDGETQCEVDGRTIACKKNNKRERLLWECFKGEREILDEEISKSFSCEPIKIRGMVDRFTLAEPTLRSSIVQIGGQGNNYDYTFMRGSRPVNIELKTNKSSTKEAALLRVPWTGYGQLIQIFVNVKDEKYKPLFQSFDMDGMVRRWFDTVIMTEIVPKYRIEGPITYESYCKLSFNTSKKAETLFEDASLPVGTIALFKHFHENREKADNKYRGDLWKGFTRMWMETHQFDPSLVLELIKSTLNKKDIWVCTTKQDAYVIPGPKCKDALPDFKGVKHNKEASILIYELTLINETTGEEYKVEFKFRFYWKNGGQGVHNLCLQIG